jgi:hypothetical protein
MVPLSLFATARGHWTRERESPVREREREREKVSFIRNYGP